MKIRIKFQKYGVMKFIGHLDMMRYFQKVMRRADIDIKYSEGFSPHQIMSFAAPLGVGVTSDGEYLDIEVNHSLSSEVSLKALNDVMVEGVRVTQYRKLSDGTRNAMSSVACADYTVHFKQKADNPFCLTTLCDALKGFYEEQEEILITKQTKKSERIMDLKPLIYELRAISEPVAEDSYADFHITEENPGFFLRLNTGSSDNVKPELVLEAFFSYCSSHNICSVTAHPAAIQVHRLEVYGPDLVPLGDFGEDIPNETDGAVNG